MFISRQASGIAVVLLLVREITALLLSTKNLRDIRTRRELFSRFRFAPEEEYSDLWTPPKNVI